MISTYTNYILNQAQLLNYANILLAKEAIMLLKEQHYETGSDYTEPELNRSLEDWQKRQTLSELLGMKIENRTDEEVDSELFNLMEIL